MSWFKKRITTIDTISKNLKGQHWKVLGTHDVQSSLLRIRQTAKKMTYNLLMKPIIVVQDYKDILKDNGLSFENAEDWSVNDFVAKKYFKRYLRLMDYMKARQYPLTWGYLQIIYRMDIVFREEIRKFLSGIETTLTSRLQYICYENNITIEKICDGSVLWNKENATRSVEKSFDNSLLFINKALKNLNEKYGSLPFDEIIGKMTFGQVNGMYTILDDKYKENAFDEKIVRLKFSESLRVVIALRNHIAHHEQLIVNKIFLSKTRQIKVKDALESLVYVSMGDVVNDIHNKLLNYKVNVIKKNMKTFDKDVLETIFSDALKLVK